VAAALSRPVPFDGTHAYTSAHAMECALIAVRDRLARKPYARAPVLVAAGATAALALALLVWRTASDQFRDTSPSERNNWIQITNFGDSVTAPALSPDGRMLAFILGPIPFFGPGQIYVKELPDGPPEQLTDDDLHKDDPVFSPDGSQIAYTTVEPDTLKWDTQIIPVRGTAAPRGLVNASGLTWIGEGRFLFSEIKKGVRAVQGELVAGRHALVRLGPVERRTYLRDRCAAGRTIPGPARAGHPIGSRCGRVADRARHRAAANGAGGGWIVACEQRADPSAAAPAGLGGPRSADCRRRGRARTRRISSSRATWKPAWCDGASTI
jgi:hypothetical protein